MDWAESGKHYGGDDQPARHLNAKSVEKKFRKNYPRSFITALGRTKEKTVKIVANDRTSRSIPVVFSHSECLMVLLPPTEKDEGTNQKAPRLPQVIGVHRGASSVRIPKRLIYHVIVLLFAVGLRTGTTTNRLCFVSERNIIHLVNGRMKLNFSEASLSPVTERGFDFTYTS